MAELGRLSIEDLANIDVSSVTKSTQPLSDAPASVFVITHDDIMRAGARSIPEILRLAPNVQVAQINAASHAVSARGFNGGSADKLLVLIDGRSVYSPFFHGVLWDAQYVPPRNIDRIEVISGPGATLWGANAVNGVINVVTRSSADTQGWALKAGGGNLERRASLQYSGTLSEDLTFRIYGDGMDHRHGETITGADARDGWRMRQGGFRADWSPGDNLITMQGDIYGGQEKQPASPNQVLSGHNLIARWTRPTAGGGKLQVQAYYDDLARTVKGVLDYSLRTYDLEVQHSFVWGSRHSIVWGGGYRVTDDNFAIVPTPARTQFFNPVGARQTLSNVFAQDAISLTPALTLSLGLRLEDDPYTGLEPLPSARVAWKVSDSALIWAAVSRAVRAPSRLDRDFGDIRGTVLVLTGRNFQAEKLIAYELGYRGQPSARSSLSVSAYYNVYDDLRSFETTKGQLPIVFDNLLEGDTYGLEAWGSYQVAAWWRLSAGFSWLHKELHYKPGAARLFGTEIAGNDPAHQVSLRSTMDLGHGVSFDFDLRNIDDLPAPASSAYTELGAQIRWMVSPHLEIALIGSNLLHAQHSEFGSTSSTLQLGPVGVESGRSVFLDTRWRF